MRDERTYRLIGAAMEVHNHYGPGFLEMTYQNAFELELGWKAIPFLREPPVPISYKGHPTPSLYRPDFLCFGEVIVEHKAHSGLGPADDAQVLHYLAATELKVGLLLNFGREQLEYRRFVMERPSARRGLAAVQGSTSGPSDARR